MARFAPQRIRGLSRSLFCAVQQGRKQASFHRSYTTLDGPEGSPPTGRKRADQVHWHGKYTSRYRPSKSFEVERTLAHKKVVSRILDALQGETEDIEPKLASLNVLLHPVAVVEVVKKLPLHAAWTFFCWARGHNGFQHEVQTYIAMVRRIASERNSKYLKQLHDDMGKDGFKLDLTAYINLMRAYAKAGQLEEAFEIWSLLKHDIQPDVNAYNRIIAIMLQGKKHQQALQFYKEMLQAKCSPNAGTYHFLIESLVDAGRLESAFAIIKRMPRLGIRPYQPTYKTLLQAYMKSKDLDAVISLLVHMSMTNRDPPLKLMEKVRKACIKSGKSMEELVKHWGPYFAYTNVSSSSSGGDSSTSGRSDEGTTTGSEFEDTDEDLDVDKNTLASILTPWNMSTAQRLQKMDFKWSNEVVTYLMKDLEDVDVAFGFFEWLRSQEGYTHDARTYSKMIILLLSSRRFQLIDCLLDEMHEQGFEVPNWVFNRIIEAYSSCRDAPGALKLFAKMQKIGSTPDGPTYTGMIDILMREGMYQRAMEIYGQMLQAGFEPNNFTYSVLINGLGLAGKAEAGHKLVNIMRKHGYKPNVITYTAVIGGYEKLGRLSDIVEVYKEMQNAGIEPTPITYRVLSQAFYRSGKWEDGRKMEEKMQELISSDAGAAVIEESRRASYQEILDSLEDLADA